MTPEKQQEIRDLLDAMASRFAKPGCGTCNGKGHFVANPPGMVVKASKVDGKKGPRPGYRMLCQCAKDGYARKVKILLPLPCSDCGSTNYCEHRPRDLQEYLETCRERWTQKE